MRIPIIDQYREVDERRTIYIPSNDFEKPDYIFIDEKAKTKFIKQVEKVVRGSLEYKEYIEYLSNNVGMNLCSFFNNINKALARSIRIEIHHEPFSLFDIVSIILEKNTRENKIIEPIKIAKEVMKVHFMGKVGLIPLSSTVHELVHDGKVFIPLQYIDEGFMRFYDDYKEYIPEPLKDILISKIELSKTFDNSSNNILKRQYVYIETEGYSQIPQKLVA